MGLLIGVVATLLAGYVIEERDKDVPEQLTEALGCSDGIYPSSAAAVHHAPPGYHRFSWFAATHAERILGINGCEPVGPATTYLEFGDWMNMRHVLATLDNLGAVCVVGQALFDGELLSGRAQLEELCDTVGGQLEVPHRPNG
ncbi:MAG TPA: hypothetical protein VJQ84_08070 [Solirubrobacterales bacterium]|nr:hypothetical protein [Solirubrobacterales bacterium]